LLRRLRCSAGDFDVELGMLQCFYQPQDGSTDPRVRRGNPLM
jgi:hypothetical protein